MSTLLMLLTLAMIALASRIAPDVHQGARHERDAAPAAARAVPLPAARLRRWRRLPSVLRRAADAGCYLYNWNNYISEETVERFEAALQLPGSVQDYYSRQRGDAGQAGGRAPAATTCWCPPATRCETLIRAGRAAAARQVAAAQPQEHQAGVPRHRLRPGQPLLGALRLLDHADRLQRAEDEGAGAARPTPGR
ncbi:MAG: hypothetical protein MZV65_44245 [Chromatiales bacterium]|nr:hypothetical protein [Chromatiales bacterium]